MELRKGNDSRSDFLIKFWMSLPWSEGDRAMYAKLVFRNAKRSVKDYLVYIVTMTICVTLFYAFLSISSSYYSPDIGSEYDFTLLSDGMKIAICMITLLLLFLIRFVNHYMLRRKQKEFAVQSIMGMEQKPLAGFSLQKHWLWVCFPFWLVFLRCILLSIHYRNAPYCLWKALWNLMDIIPGYRFVDSGIFCGKFFCGRNFQYPYHSENKNYWYAFRRERERTRAKKEPLHFCCSSPLWSIYRMGIDDRNTKGLVLLWHPLCVSGAAYVLGKYSFSAAYFAVVDILHN